jgi:hypothetical protein
LKIKQGKKGNDVIFMLLCTIIFFLYTGFTDGKDGFFPLFSPFVFGPPSLSPPCPLTP